MTDYSVLPENLPEPQDDGAADHLPGRVMPTLTLMTSDGAAVDLAELGAGRSVLYLYPLTGRPGTDLPEGWDAIPGGQRVLDRSVRLPRPLRRTRTGGCCPHLRFI